MVFGAVLTASAPARADVGVSGWVRGGFAEQARGFDWGVGGHLGYEVGDFFLIGAAVRFNQVPVGYLGIHHSGDLSMVARLRLPFWVVQPYLTAYAGAGFWEGVVDGHAAGEPFAFALGGEVGTLIELTDGILLRVGLEMQTFHGGFNDVSLVLVGNGVVGLDFVF